MPYTLRKMIEDKNNLDEILHLCRYGKTLLLLLTSRFIPSGVVRENGAPSATVSTYLFRLFHCHQPLHTCPPGGPRALYVTFLQYLWHCVFEGQPRPPPTSLTAHLPLSSILCDLNFYYFYFVNCSPAVTNVLMSIRIIFHSEQLFKAMGECPLAKLDY